MLYFLYSPVIFSTYFCLPILLKTSSNMFWMQGSHGIDLLIPLCLSDTLVRAAVFASPPNLVRIFEESHQPKWCRWLVWSRCLLLSCVRVVRQTQTLNGKWPEDMSSQFFKKKKKKKKTRYHTSCGLGLVPCIHQHPESSPGRADMESDRTLRLEPYKKPPLLATNCCKHLIISNRLKYFSQ